MAFEMKFKNILTERRQEFSNFLWVSRPLNSHLFNKQTPSVLPKDHKSNALSSRKIVELIKKIKNGKSEEDVFRSIKLILDEIAFSKHLPTIRWLGYFLTKICSKVCSGIYINESEISKLKSSVGPVPIVYVPSHRSYADFILLSYVLFTMDIEIPAIAAGMDFYNMKVMGTVLRNTGAFFMRRSFNNDELYWETFKEYVHQLTTKCESGIEFFIEGMRSRSCKSLPPKYGLLFMILKAFMLGEVPDILLVPINISYDRVLEEKLFAFELLGVPKPKETTSGFFKSLSIIKESYGNIFLNFGEPISVQTYFKDKFKRNQFIEPVYTTELSSTEKSEIITLGEDVLAAQKQLCVISIFNLISIILIDCRTMNKNNISLNELQMKLESLYHIFKSIGANVIDINDHNVRESLKIHSNVASVDTNFCVTILQNEYDFSSINKEKLKGYELSEETMSQSIPFIMLQLYVNPTISFIIMHSFILNVMELNQVLTEEKLYEETAYLESVYSHEFTLFRNDSKKNFRKALLELKELNLIEEETTGEYKCKEGDSKIIINLIRPFLFCYFNVYKAIERNDFEDCITEKLLILKSQEEIESFINSTESFIHPYALSLDSISLCLKSLVTCNAIYKINLNNSTRYKINYSVLDTMMSRIGKYVDLHLRQPIHYKNKL